MDSSPDIIPGWIKSLAAILSALGLLMLSPLALGSACLIFIAMASRDRDALGFGLFGALVLAVTFGLGATFWHSTRALANKPSAPLRLPRAWVFASIFALCVGYGIFVYPDRTLGAWTFPLALLVAAAIPPLAAIAWFAPTPSAEFSWRRGSVAFVGGATASVAIALALEVILPLGVLIVMLVFGNPTLRGVERLLSDLIGGRGAQALTNPSFVYAFIHVALIAPLAEEIAKPLITLPLIGRLARREAFLVAAMAGAGFAALENVVYASAATSYWVGLLIVRGIGGALHPLGAGLVGLAWRDILRRERHAWRTGLARFGLAFGLHALWNGGSLIVIALVGAQLFGKPPPALNVLGFSAAGLTLALLIVLGIVTLWVGRAVAENVALPRFRAPASFDAQFTVSDRAVAIWALAWLAIVVPLGLIALRVLFQ